MTDSVRADRFQEGDCRQRSGTRIFSLAIALVMFSVPFGVTQDLLLGGMTIAKLILPALFLALLGIRLARFKLHPHFLLVASFIMATTPSFLLSDQYVDVALNLASYGMLFLLLYNALRRVEDLRIIFVSYFAGMLAVSLLGMVALVFEVDAGATVGRPLVEIWYGLPIMSGTEDNPNAFATFLVAGIPIGLFLRQTAISGWTRFLYGTGVLLFLIVVGLTYSRSGIAGAIVGASFVIYCNKSRLLRRRHVLLASAVSLAVLGTVLAASIDGLGMTGETGSDGGTPGVFSNKVSSQESRFTIAGQYYPLIAENPFVGVGFGNLKQIMRQQTGLANNSHNMIFGVGIEFGLPAMLLFGSIILLSVRSAAKGMARALKPADKSAGACILGVIAGLFIHGMFHEIYVNLMLWLFIGLGGVYATLVGNRRMFREDAS